MKTFLIILGSLMLATGAIGIAAIRFLIWPDPTGSKSEQQLYNGFAPYILGAAILLVLLGAALLRANGIDFGWPESR